MMQRMVCTPLLAAMMCAAAPVHAQPASPPPSPPRCVAAAGAPADSALVRWDCAGSRHTGAVRFSLSLPAGWEVEQSEDRSIVLKARGGASGVYVQAGDQLWNPTTAADSADFWTFATDLMLGRAPTPREVAELRRDAGDEEGARFMVSRAQGTDSGLMALAEGLASTSPDVQVTARTREIRTLAGQRAGYMSEVKEKEGETWESEGWVTARDAVFYGILVTAPAAEFRANRALWERVAASFVIHAVER
jgi:hypothetical protein